MCETKSIEIFKTTALKSNIQSILIVEGSNKENGGTASTKSSIIVSAECLETPAF